MTRVKEFSYHFTIEWAFNAPANAKLKENSSRENVEANDHVVVKFSLQETEGEKRWIGEMVGISDDNDEYCMLFYRCKKTRQHFGFIYYYPEKENRETVSQMQVLYELEPSTEFQRCL